MATKAAFSGGKTGAKAIEHLIKQLSKATEVKVGWDETVRYPGKHRNGGDYVAHVAAINEFGGAIDKPGEPIEIKAYETKIYRRVNGEGEFQRGAQFVKPGSSNYESTHTVGSHMITIPARPFFRTMIEAKKGKWGGRIATALEANDFNAKVALGLVGNSISQDLAESIDKWTDPPNAPSTIARKGEDNPLDETHQMRTSIIHKVE